jgi:hypothetical protein
LKKRAFCNLKLESGVPRAWGECFLCYLRYASTKTNFSAVKYACIVLLLVVPFVCTAQQGGLHWYTLQSAVYITEAQGKEVVTVLRDLDTDRIVRFVPKKQAVVIATSEPLNVPLVVQRLNAFGFFLGDVTNGIVHRTGNLAITSLFYQTVLQCTYPNIKPEFPKYFVLNESEYQALPLVNREKAEELGLEVLPE